MALAWIGFVPVEYTGHLFFQKVTYARRIIGHSWHHNMVALCQGPQNRRNFELIPATEPSACFVLAAETPGWMYSGQIFASSSGGRFRHDRGLPL